MSGGHAHSHDGHDHADGHDHGLTDASRLRVALLVIAGFMVVEVVGGLLSGSLALIADAGHMATDAIALALALGAKWLAQKPVTPSFPFGLKRAQVLAAFVNGLGLFVLIGFLLWESVKRLAEPPEIGSTLMLVVAVLGLLANIIAFFVLHGGDRHDVNMRGAILHVIGDILGSVAAIVSAVVIATTGWLYADPLVTLLVSALIARSAWQLTRETAHVLLQGAPETVDTTEMRAVLLDAAPDATDIHDFRLWMLTPAERELSMHVTVRDPACANATLMTLKKVLSERYGITHSTIQMDAGRGEVVPFCMDAEAQTA
ncbi:cation diffusion facilitator family transporter [Parvularcula dongshanensis]|uniref:Cobalt-zinc-cadmium efflux system protein n=1 Tax=Parvularcula dongshanensis TaxID=1173995 RepID=A0A840I014_9PROT|nr:cation diffusion facilitator family transporter [Parvularcula dongshanensis]MBB4657613.1 cobalt-zinc-cadmium efflux system protein [Parvularcula dongshanensis]